MVDSLRPETSTPLDQTDGAQPTIRRRHLLDLDDFTREDIDEVLDNADGMSEVLSRDIRKVPTLRGKSVVTLFLEPSTRTRVSFEQAGKILGADVINVSGSGSSAEKGESLFNTALTLQAIQAEAIVVRHSHAGAPYFLARTLNSSIINAGDGSHAHPTQALLDLYTIKRHFGSIEGLRVVLVGDILYSRVARSNLWALTTMGASVVLCSPPTLMPADFTNGYMVSGCHPFKTVSVEDDLDRAIIGADIVMALRVQKERQTAGHLPSLKEYSKVYGVTSERMKLANPGALVMHPGPMNEGIEIDSAVAHGPKSVIEEQVTNGVAVRMALLYQFVK